MSSRTKKLGLLLFLILVSQPIKTESFIHQGLNPFTNETTLIKVAVVDTGIIDHQLLHPYLIEDSPFMNIDLSGHGTHIAGIIANVGNPYGNQLDYSQVKILGLSTVSLDDPTHLDGPRIRSQIEYAIQNNVRIINLSFGSFQYNEEEEKVIQKASDHGILIIAAAGNENIPVNKGGKKFYPAMYKPKNMIIVGNIYPDGRPTDSTNYGLDVDLSAVSTIDSITIQDTIEAPSGTSFSAAIVSRAAAHILAFNPSLTATEVKSILLSTVSVVPKLKGYNHTSGALDEPAALVLAKTKKSLVLIK
jgi:subtilisin family serine protease